MLNMYWSWVFLTVIVLLVQPSQALHIHQDISNVARNQETTSSGFWLRALEPMKPAPSTALIVVILLSLLLLILGAVAAFLWYRRKMSQRTNNSEKGLPFIPQLRGDIEKGSSMFSPRTSEKQGYGFSDNMTSAAIKKPAPPMLPFLPKQPTILERISDARTSLFFPNPRASAQFLDGPRVLVPPPPPVHRPTSDRPQGARPRPSTASKAEFPSPRNPFVPSPSHLSVNLQIMTPQKSVAPANVPSGLLEKTTRQDPARAERVRMLRMDLTEDFMEIEKLTASSQVMHLGEESLARLKGAKTAKTGKSVRYMLPSSPRTPLMAAKSAATSMGIKTPNASSFRPLFLSPKTAKI